MRKLSPRAHGWIDYLIVLFFVLAPSLFGYADDQAAATTSYIIAAAHLGLSVLTRYPLGIVKLIPFPTHGAIELAVGFVLIALPWIVGFDDNQVARNLFIGSGLAVFVVYAVTDYRRADIESGFRRGTPLTR